MQSEYIKLFENINVPIFGIDKYGIINEWNSSMENLFSYSRKDVIRKEFTKLLIDKSDESSSNFVNDSLKGVEISNRKLILLSKDKKEIKLLISTTNRRNVNNEITGNICVGHDITDIDDYKLELEKKVDDKTLKLINALKKEKDVADMKSQFISMATYEFKNPLATIDFTAGLLKRNWEKIDDYEKKQKLGKIKTQVKYMIHLLDNVLTYSKTEADKIELEPKKVNIYKLLLQLIEEVQIYTKDSHEIEFEYNSKKCFAQVDKKIIRNIFINLLTNAIKFSPDSEHIKINLKESESVISIEIIDYGIGINPNEGKYIFSPFFRGKNAKKIKGTGLGLAIVKESVDLLDGTITLESKIGEGSKFKVILPKDLSTN